MSTTAPARPAAPLPLRRTRAWRVALRLGARDARRHPVRTAVALLMIALPVAAAAALVTLLPTLLVDGEAAATARMGQAAGVVTDEGYDEAEQLADSRSAGGSADGRDLYTEAEVVDLVGAPVTRVLTRYGVTTGTDTLVTVTEIDTTAPLTRGMYTVREGRLPQAPGEVALNPVAADALGVAVGDRTEVAGEPVTVVGVAHPAYGLEQPMDRPWVLAVTGSLLGEPQVSLDLPGDDDSLQWLVGREEPLTAADIAELNAAGLFGDSRDEDVLGGGTLLGPGAGGAVVLLTVAVVLVLIEITLLAGPAFAVGVRTQRRTLAQLAATGADARALKQVVLGQALVIGVLAGVGGALLGTVAVAGTLAVLRATRDDWTTGPLDVSVVGLLLVVLAAVVAAVGAAAGPAASVAGDDVALALRGATGTRAVPARRGVLGGALFVTGAAVMVLAGTSASVLAVGLLVTTVGALLVVPLLVATLGPVSRHLPLPFRIAARDAARAAGRSVAAVAAVTGATAGLVAALTALASIDSYEAATYEPRLPAGAVEISPAYYPPPVGWEDRLESALAELAPGATVAYEGSVAEGDISVPAGGRPFVLFVPTTTVPAVPDGAAAGDAELYDWNVLGLLRAADPAAAALLPGLSSADLRWLADGGLLASPDSASRLWTQPDGTVLVQRLEIDASGTVLPDREVAVPVRTATLPGDSLLVGVDTARALGGFVPDRAVVLGEELDQTAADELGAAAADPTTRSSGVSVYVEDGPESRFGSGAAPTVTVLAGLVVLVGALTATGLALSDARRDRVVLAAAGASPALQRLVAGAVTVVVVTLGAMGGTALGLVPGVVVAWRLTDSVVPDPESLRSGVLVPGVELPWLAIALLTLLVPWLLGALVAALARPVPDQEVTQLVSRV